MYCWGVATHQRDRLIVCLVGRFHFPVKLSFPDLSSPVRKYPQSFIRRRLSFGVMDKIGLAFFPFFFFFVSQKTFSLPEKAEKGVGGNGGKPS